jgi:hypothetical protein
MTKRHSKLRKSFYHSILLILALSTTHTCHSQSWNDCCKGYEAGYKKGFSYPNMIYANTVVPPPCGCYKITGGYSYDAGFAVGFEDGRVDKLKQSNQKQQPKFQTNEYIHSPSFGYNKRENDNIDIFYLIFSGWFRLFPEWGFGVSNHLTYSDEGKWGGTLFVRHDFSKRFRLGLDYSSYSNTIRSGVGLGLDYNFNKKRPMLNKYNYKSSTLNPTLGAIIYIPTLKDQPAYCGTAGLELWSAPKNGASLGLGLKYIIGS